ncbi:MAG: non-canonical purine NTP pyrophosphatase, partial [Bacillota bacterium]
MEGDNKVKLKLNFFSNIMNELVIASDNLNKIGEYQNKLQKLTLIPYKKLVDIEIAETGKTFKENALIKAKTISKLTNKPCIGDDSGLVVEALPNQLGVFSKRFSKAKTTKANNELLIKKLSGKNNKSAKFITVICLYIPGKNPRFYQGELK